MPRPAAAIADREIVLPSSVMAAKMTSVHHMIAAIAT